MFRSSSMRGRGERTPQSDAVARPTTTDDEQDAGEHALVAARCAPAARTAGRPARWPTATTGTRTATSVASGTAPVRAGHRAARRAPIDASPRKQTVSVSRSCGGRRVAAEQVEQQRRAGGRGRGGQRARREAGDRRAPSRGGGAPGGRAARAQRSVATHAGGHRDLQRHRVERAQHGDAGQRAGQRARPGSAAHSRHSGCGRRRSVDQRQQVRPRVPSTISSPTASLGLDRGEQQRRGDQREAEAGRGLQRRPGRDARRPRVRRGRRDARRATLSRIRWRHSPHHGASRARSTLDASRDSTAGRSAWHGTSPPSPSSRSSSTGCATSCATRSGRSRPCSTSSARTASGARSRRCRSRSRSAACGPRTCRPSSAARASARSSSA